MPETGAALALLRRIRGGDVEAEFTARKVAQKHWSQLTTPEQVKNACTVLAEYQWLRREVKQAGAKGGRPSELWRVNPYAKDADLETAEVGA